MRLMPAFFAALKRVFELSTAPGGLTSFEPNPVGVVKDGCSDHRIGECFGV